MNRFHVLTAVVTALSLFGPIVASNAAEPFLTTRLELRTAPTGATVVLDGVEVGTTPLDLDAVRPGRRRLTVSYRGYTTYTEWIELPAGRTVRREIDLEPLTREVRFETAIPNLEIYLNGAWKPAGTVSLRPGNASIRFRAFGFREERLDVTIPPGPASEPLRVSVDLSPVESPTITADYLGPVAIVPGERTRSATVAVTADAAASVRLEVRDAQSVLRYSTHERVTRRRETFTWDGRSGDGVFVEPGEYRLTLIFDDAVILETDLRVSVASSISPVPLRNGAFSTFIGPVPASLVAPRISTVIAGGARQQTGDVDRTGVPGGITVVGTILRRAVVGTTAELIAYDDRKEPTGAFTFSLGTTQLTPIPGVAVAPHIRAAIVQDRGNEITTVYDADVPVSIGRNSWTAVIGASARLPTEEDDVTPRTFVPAPTFTVTYSGTALFGAAGARFFLAERRRDGDGTRWVPLERYGIDLSTRPNGGAFHLQGGAAFTRTTDGFLVEGDIGFGWSH